MSPGPDGYVRYEVHDVDTGGFLRSDVNHYINDVLGVSIEVNSLLLVEWGNMRSSTLPGQVRSTLIIVESLLETNRRISPRNLKQRTELNNEYKKIDKPTGSLPCLFSIIPNKL